MSLEKSDGTRVRSLVKDVDDLTSATLVECVSRAPCDGCLDEVRSLVKDQQFQAGDRATCPHCLGLLKSILIEDQDALFVNSVVKHQLTPNAQTLDEFESQDLAKQLMKAVHGRTLQFLAFSRKKWPDNLAKQWMALNGFSDPVVTRSTDEHRIYAFVPGAWLVKSSSRLAFMHNDPLAGIVLATGILMKEAEDGAPGAQDFEEDGSPLLKIEVYRPKQRGRKKTEKEAPSDEGEPSLDPVDPESDEFTDLTKGFLAAVRPDLKETDLKDAITGVISAVRGSLTESRQAEKDEPSDLPALSFDKSVGKIEGSISGHGHTHEICKATCVVKGQDSIVVTTGVANKHCHVLEISTTGSGPYDASREIDPVTGDTHSHRFEVKESQSENE